MDYSQNGEQLIISNFFYTNNISIENIHILDIGANEGKILSNSFFFIKAGAYATLVEPAPKAFNELQQRHATNSNVFCINKAVSNYNGKSKFFDSDSHLSSADSSLLSTLNIEETKRWSNQKFEEIEVDVIDFKTLLELSPYKEFQFISTDAEGEDVNILKQIDFRELKTMLVCVEWNSKDQEIYDEIIMPFGFRLIHKNAENLIYAI